MNDEPTRNAARRAAACMACAMTIATAVPATAQDEPYVASVRAREEARAEDSPVRLGAFLLSPQINVDSTYDDNIFATDTGRRGDIFVSVRPEAFLRSNWSNHSVSAHGYFERTFYGKFSSEQASNFGGDIAGRLDVSRQTRLFASASLIRANEKRSDLSSFFSTRQPVRFTSFTAQIAAEQDFGSLKLRGDAGLRRYTYGDATLSTGILDGDFRNVKVWNGSLQAGYDLNTLTQFILRGTVEARRYDLRPGEPGFDPITQVDRSGDSSRLEVGIQREVTRLILATGRVGYLNFRYPDRRLQDISALSYFLNVRWNVTPLTTVNLSAQRRIDETSSPVTAGNLRDEVRLGVDHELLRSLILTGTARLAWIDPAVAPGVSSVIAASSREREAGIEARYYIGRSFRVQGGYTYVARSSDDRLISFRSNRLTVGVNYVF